jgi:hypothetical protein
LNDTTFFAGIFIGSLVKGLIPSLAALFLEEKVPKPTSATFPSFLSPLVIPAKVASNTLPASALETPASAAINSTNSVFDIIHYLP